MSNAKPVRIPMGFDEAIRRALQVSPEPKPPRRRRKGGTPKGRKRRRLAWYFMAASTLPFGTAGVTTHGPFPTKTECEAAAKWAAKAPSNSAYPILIYPCWSDGR